MRIMAKKQSIDKGLYYSATCGVRAVNLEDYGVPCVPLLSRNHFTNRMPSVEEHVHVGFVEILYCLGGNITYESMGTSYPFRPGKIFVSRPDEPHRMVTYPKGLDTFSLLFRIPPKGARFLNLRGDEAVWLRDRMLDMPQRLFDGTDMTRKLFQHVFDVVAEFPQDTPERRLLLRTAVVNLFLDIITASRRPERVQPLEHVENVIAAMRAHPEARYPVEDIAQQSGLSETNFTLRFKAATGLPPHAFLLECRIERAKQVLRSARLSMAAIAYSLGFPSAQHFATQFRKLTGVSPGEWRRTASS